MKKTYLFIAVTLLLFLSLSSFLNPEMDSNARVTQSNIDLGFLTYLGGSDFDRAQGCAVDSQGYIYIHGNTKSSDLPATTGAFDTKFNGDQDAFVAKITPDGKHLVWLTYLGGRGEDRGYGLKVDNAGYVYLAGATKSSDFPTTAGAYDRSYNGVADVFVAKLLPDGSGLVYSTYVGGSAEDWSRGGMYLNNSGEIYLGGRTESTNFPTTSGAFQRTHRGNWDGFLLKLSVNGSSLIFSTLLGGSGWDLATSEVIVHSDGSVYIGGTTNSKDFPITPGAFQTGYGGDLGNWWAGDGFVARFSSDGSRLRYSTYLGGSGDDNVSGNHGLAVDLAGRVIANGNTSSFDFPTTSGAYQGSHRGGNPEDGFITKLSADGKQLLYSTYIGGTGWEEWASIAVDTSGNVYGVGNSQSIDYPVTPNAYQLTYGGGDMDIVFSRFSPDLSTLTYSTYLGGSGTGSTGERGRCVALDPAGNLIISGDTNSPDFPTTPNSIQNTYRGNGDGFVARFAMVGMTIDGISINGPTAGLDNAVLNFTALTYPITSTRPITYVWHATEQAPVTNTNSISDTVNFTWSITGTKNITVTATNDYGTVTDTHTIDIYDICTVCSSTYLPVILQGI